MGSGYKDVKGSWSNDQCYKVYEVIMLYCIALGALPFSNFWITVPAIDTHIPTEDGVLG